MRRVRGVHIYWQRPPVLSDQAAIEKLIAHYGTARKAADAMNIGETHLANWRRRRISNDFRPLVLLLLRHRLGVRLRDDWAWPVPISN